jgi:hypothetical protein
MKQFTPENIETVGLSANQRRCDAARLRI